LKSNDKYILYNFMYRTKEKWQLKNIAKGKLWDKEFFQLFG